MVKSQFSSLKAWLGVAVVFVLILASGLARHYIFYPEPEKPPRVAVRSYEVQEREIKEKREYTGRIESVSRVNVQAQVSGEVLAANFREGDRVEAGDTLVRLDDSEIKARLEGLRARRRSAREVLSSRREDLEAARAEKNYLAAEKERQQNLFERGLAPRSRLDEIESQHSQAASRVENLRARIRSQQEEVKALTEQLNEVRTRLSYATVKAPVTGLVVEQKLEQGELAQPGRPLYLLDSRDGYRVKFSYPQEDLSLLETGQEVLLHFPGEIKEGMITRIHGALTPRSLATAEIELEELPDFLKSGSYISLEVIYKRHDSVPVVPETAVVSRNDRNYIYLIQDSKLQLREIEPGAREEGRTAVRELEPGSLVATGAFLELTRNYDGQPVAVYENN